MGHRKFDIRHRHWTSDIRHLTSDIGGLNFCPRFFGGFVWSPRDFFGFLFLPPFEHPCLLKSGVPPPPPPQPPTSEYGAPLRIIFETSIVSLNDFKRERKLPHFNIISDRFQYQDSMYKIFNKTFFVHDVGSGAFWCSINSTVIVWCLYFSQRDKQTSYFDLAKEGMCGCRKQ